MSDGLKTIFFAVALCLVCSFSLTVAATGLKTYQRENALVDRQKNVLKAVGAIDPARRYSTDDIKTLYQSSIKCVSLGESGEVLSADTRPENPLPLYLYEKDGQTAAYIVPVDSRGLWGRINGYLALEPDGSTIAGFSVYQHSETPGLGGEIENQWFQRNFVGKQIIGCRRQFRFHQNCQGRGKGCGSAGSQAELRRRHQRRHPDRQVSDRRLGRCSPDL